MMKGELLFFKRSISVIIVFLLACLTAGTIFAAELRDNRLPSEKARPSYDRQTVSPNEDFRSKVKKLNIQQRKEIRAQFAKKMDAASGTEEKSYYKNLILIIDDCGSK